MTKVESTSSEIEVKKINEKVKLRSILIFEDGNPGHKKRNTTCFGLTSGHTSPGKIIPLKSISLFEN